MKKILFVTSSYGDSTGGTKYDRAFIEELRKNNDLDIKVMVDIDFTDKKLDWKLFGKEYEKHVNEFATYDYFITNSRLYTRFGDLIKRIKRFGTKVICFHHHYNFMTHANYKFLVHKFLELRFLNSCDIVIHASPYVFDLSKHLLKNSNSLRIIHLPVPTYNKKMGYNVNSNEIVFLGNIEKRKGIIYLLKALKILLYKNNNIVLKLIGSLQYDVEYSDYLIKYVKDNKLEKNVIFLGRLDENEKIKVLKESKFFVFPSLHEGFGLVILEAMASGLPVIAFNNSAMPYTIKNEFNGLLVKNKSSKKFANSVLKLFNNNDLCKQLSIGAIQTVDESFILNDFAKHVGEFAEEIARLKQ